MSIDLAIGIAFLLGAVFGWTILSWANHEEKMEGKR